MTWRQRASEQIQAIADTVIWHRAILDPPPRDGWPTRFRLFRRNRR